jgi:hypothetical protein
MKKMATSNVLIVGMKGLGVEIGKFRALVRRYTTDSIAKNIALAGVKTVTVYDPSPVEIADLGTQVSLLPLQLQHELMFSSSCERLILGNPELRSLHQD